MPVRGDAAYRMSRKLELLRRRLLWWNKVEVGNLLNQIKKAEDTIHLLQTKEDAQGYLSDEDLQVLCTTFATHHTLLQNQETLWRQNSRVNWLREGDRNIQFFHQATIIRRHTNTIRALYSDHEGWMEDADSIRREFLHYFMTRWTVSTHTNFNISSVLPQNLVTVLQNYDLLKQVIEEEIKSTLWSFTEDKAPGPDGYPPFFFRAV